MIQSDFDFQQYFIYAHTSEFYYAGGGNWLTIARCTVMWEDEDDPRLLSTSDLWLCLSDEFFNVYDEKIDTAAEEWPEPVESYNLFECYDIDNEKYDFGIWTKPAQAIMDLDKFYAERSGFVC